MANELDQYLSPEEQVFGVAPGPNGRPRVMIDTPPTNKLIKGMEGAGNDDSYSPGQQAEPGGFDLQATIAKIGELISGLGAGAGVEPGQRFNPAVEKLFGLNGVERFQTWPEKMLRSGATLPGDVVSGQEPMTLPGLRREDFTDIPGPQERNMLGLRPDAWQPGDRVVERAQDTAGLMGGGSLGGTNAAEATLGSGPVLRSALKHEGRVTKADTPNGLHGEIFPDSVARYMEEHGLEWSEDVPGVESGFVNHKGQFLSREKAAEYALENDLLKPEYIPMVKKGGAINSEMLLSDAGTPGAPISALAKQSPVFYSAVEHAVTNAPQPKMGFDQWMGYLKNQPGVKGEELSWMGLGEKSPFEGKSVTKAQMEDWVNNHKVEIKEIEKGMGSYTGPQRTGEEWSRLVNEAERRGDFDAAEQLTSQWEAAEGVGGSTGVKFPSYQLPGGENYREMLFTLPQRTPNHPAKALADKLQALDDGWKGFLEGVKEANGGRLPDRKKWDPQQIEWENANRAERATALEQFKKATGGDGFDPVGEYGKANNAVNYNSSHWDEPNVLAHTRLNDRVIDGKKSLHVEEIQSDWHQEGRKKGYKSETKPLSLSDVIEVKDAAGNPQYHVKLGDGSFTPKFDTKEQALDIANTITSNYNGKMGGVPDAPFKTTWPDLVLKRLIREASEKGYGQISWTPGEAQAARYDLSKQVDKIAVPMVNENGTRSVRIDSKQGSPFKLMVDKDGVVDGSHAGSQFSGKSLSDVVGKEMADKIMKLDKPHEFSGEGLKIGGEGMKAFYDKMLVDKANALGKKFGAKVGTTELPGKLSARMGEPAEMHKVFTLPITDKMREAAIGKGFPLFVSGVPFPVVQVDGNPWEKQK